MPLAIYFLLINHSYARPMKARDKVELFGRKLLGQWVIFSQGDSKRQQSTPWRAFSAIQTDDLHFFSVLDSPILLVVLKT